MHQLEDGMYAWGGLRALQEYASLSSEQAALETLHLTNSSERELLRGLHAFGRGYITRRLWSVPITSFRASRPVDPDQPWQHLRDLWAPPAKLTTRQRFNEPRRPVLYFSGDPFTALAEVNARSGEYRVLLVLRKADLEHVLYMVQIGLERFRLFDATIASLGDAVGGLSMEPVLRGYLERQGILPYWQQQDRLFANIATAFYGPEEAEHRYRLSFMLAQQLQSIKGVSGLMYPSVATDYKGFNLAVATNEAKAHFVPLEAWLVSVGSNPRLYSSIPTDPSEPFVVQRGTFDAGGVIHWGKWGQRPMHALHIEIAPRRDREAALIRT